MSNTARMETFDSYLATIDSLEHQQTLRGLLSWILNEFPDLEPVIKWNQPMFTHHGTFIIGFSAAKNHFSVAPEKVTLDHFSKRIKDSGYSHGKMLFQVQWNQTIDYRLFDELISFNITDKANCQTFWRK